IVALGYLHHRTSDPATFYDGWGVSIAWYVPALTVCGAVPFFGPFSPVPIVMVLGLYFTGLGQRFGTPFPVYLTCAIVHGVCSGLVIAEVEDPAFIRVDYLPLHVQFVAVAFVELVLAGTFLIARASRRSSLAALHELEQAVRAVAQREALLEE